MARRAHDREDLLRDAVALVPRIRLRFSTPAAGGRSHEVLIGFRGDAASFYFGDDPAYHFNAAGELRRAYVDGQLIRADHRRLAALARRQSAGQSILLRRDLDDADAAPLLAAAADRLQALRAALETDALDVEGQFPADGDALDRVRRWLAGMGPLTIAESSRIE